MPYPNFGLAGQTNAFMSGQARLPYQFNLPRYGANLSQWSGNVSSLLGGQVPTDVSQLLQRQAAERGVATGSGGSPNANAAWLRALGLTSLGLQAQGAQQFTQQVAATPVPELWNPMSLYSSELELEQARLGTRGGAGGGGIGLTTAEDWSTPAETRVYGGYGINRSVNPWG